MKCDVCDTNIPIGQHQCPNCGYRMPVKKVASFDMNSKTHEHIESPRQNNQKKPSIYSNTQMSLKNQFEELKNNSKQGLDIFRNNLNQQGNQLTKIIFGVFIACGIFLISVLLIFNQINYNPYENLTFEEVMNEQYDDGSVELASQFKENIIKEMRRLGLEDIDVDEYCEDVGGLQANVRVYGYYKNISYQVSTSFQNQEQVDKTIYIGGNSKTTLLDKFQGDKKIIGGLGKFLGNPDIVKIIDECRVKVKKDNSDEEDTLVYRNSDPFISITQYPKDEEKLYHFSIIYDFIAF